MFITGFFSLQAQDIKGQWNGLLSVQGTELSLIFHISETDGKYSALMDSPDQGVKGIPMTNVTFQNNELSISYLEAGIEYNGRLESDKNISGTFKQGGMSFPLILTRKMPIKSAIKRPQEPQEPFPYYTEEVRFFNETDSVYLSGTLTLPKKDGKFPVVVLITGSGPQNRNEELLGHKPFLVISDYLTRQGIATLRYDDRGTGSSTGQFELASSADFARDAEAAVKFLHSRQEIKNNEIGLLGHSEGAIISGMIASRNPDIDFIVLLAGSAVRGVELLKMQQAAIGKASGMPEGQIIKMGELNRGGFEIVMRSKDNLQLKNDLSDYLRKVLNEFPEGERPSGAQADMVIGQMVAQMATPWMKFFLDYDPSIDLLKVNRPVLALIGSNDLQVPANPNIDALKKALAKNDKAIIKELPGLNHLFQESETGLPQEYGKIEQTISPVALSEISDFIKSIVH